MELSPKALNALVDIKRDLLSREEPPPAPLAPVKEKKRPHTFNQAHARPVSQYQKACQRHEFWSPVY